MDKKCRICGWKGRVTKHHKLKKYIWPELQNEESNIIYVCRYPCHDAIEEIIRQKENAILKQHPEIYEETIKEFLQGKYDPQGIMREVKKRGTKN